MGAAKSKPSLDDVTYLIERTCFTEAEIEAWYRDFREACPKGGLNKEQFLNIFYALRPDSNPRTFSKYVFDAFDTNRDGQIEFREFLECLFITTRGRVEERLLWAFGIYDINGDGYISVEEMTEIVAALYDMLGRSSETQMSAEERVGAIFELMDENKDGKISKQEFTTMSLQNPEVLNRLIMYQGLV
jgi:Ca2+-binding EF-hand superfamily protein